MARIGLIGGTGLDDWGGEARELSLETPFGAPSDKVCEFEIAGHSLLFLPRHGRDHTIAPHRVNYRANIHALHTLEAQAVIAVNAVGGITPNFGPAALCLPDQLIDYTWGRIHSFSHEEGSALQHAEFGRPFSHSLRDGLGQAAASLGLGVARTGCVAVTQGPRLETDAEVLRLRRDGCDMVGMTNMPEAGLACELGLPYASICVVANWAAGIIDEPIQMEEIIATLDGAMVGVRRLVSAYLERLGSDE